MEAAVIKRSGVVEVKEVPTPTPGQGEVLLKVEACAMCGTDKRVISGEKHVDVPIIGHEICGRVVKLGAGVEGVREGQRYAVQTVIGCGQCPMCQIHQENLCEKGFTAIGYQYNGGFAEYLIMPKTGVDQGCLISIPDDMSGEIGTMIEPLSCCINGLRCIPLESAGHVVILGAGTIGVFNGLLAKARGAKMVTMMNRSQPRLDVLKQIGLPFDHLVNTSQVDPVQWVKKRTNGRGVDVVVVSASAKVLVPLGMKLLARSGHMSLFAGMLKDDPVELIDLNLIHYLELHLHGANSSVRKDYIEARDYLASGRIDGRSLLTHMFPLDRFNEAFETQADPMTGSMKVALVP